MLNRRKVMVRMLTVWCFGLLGVATAQPVPPEPRMTNTSPDCPTPGEAQLRFRGIEEIKVGMQFEGKELPPDCSGSVFQGTRSAAGYTEDVVDFHWAAPNFFHQPLYFDDTPLERYGQSVCPHLQPIISGGRFFLNVPIVPYKMGYDHPYDCVTILGHYRPGLCLPCVKQVPPPISLHGALLQAGTTVGLVLLLP